MVGKRNLYFDFLRGLAIIMVVGIHTFRGYNFETTQGWISVTVRQILNCAVPLFLAISGFFMANKDMSTRESQMSFYAHQIPKVYIPTLVWGVPWLAMAIMGGKNILISVVSWFFCGLTIFYYIALIIQYYLLLPVIKIVTPPNNKCKITILITTMLSLVCVAIETWVRCIKGVELPLILYAGSFPLWILFFVIGVVISRTNRNYNIFWIVIILSVSLVLSVFESKFLNEMHGIGGFGQKTSSFIFAAMMILLLFSEKTERIFIRGGKFFKLISNIGLISYGIFQ